MLCCRCANPFESTLRYSSPAHGGWGVVRAGHQVPESYQLFVTPAACGRHGAISAYMQGHKKRLSYLYLSEEDIISGSYEDLLVDAVGDLLAHLQKQNQMPKVLMIFVSCIDDLLGTDHEALLEELRGRYPAVRFTFCHMNPISRDTGVPPQVNIQNKIYDLLDLSSVRDQGANLLGNLVSLLPDSEAPALLAEMGIAPVRHLAGYSTFDGFQEMARSQLNIVIAPPGKYAASNFEKKHGTPYLMALTSYRLEEIAKNYGEISKFSGFRCPDLSDYEAHCREEIEETRRILDNIPIAIDDEAAARPFDLARALLSYGFRIGRMVVQQSGSTDQENFGWMREKYPDIPLQQPQHHRAPLFEERIPECLAIGYSSAYLTGARYVAPVDPQLGHGGYAGLCDMMRILREAVLRPANLKTLIDDAGLVV